MERAEYIESQPQQYPIKPVPFTEVRCSDSFWAPRIEINRAVTVPFAFRQCETSGRMDLFRRSAASMAGDPAADKTMPYYPFDDSDVYKVLEGAAYTLRSHRDAALEEYIDDLVDLIGTAQELDGYLYPARTINPEQPHHRAGAHRWELERAHSHELYNLGHLYEAAIAYEQATGKRKLLEIALKSADLLVSTFGEGRQTIWPGHQITELALVKLYHATGDEQYLELAKFMLDKRGPDASEGSSNEYNQSHLPVTEQTEAVGHAVRATYMYAGMADVAASTGDGTLVAAIDRIWDDVVGRKLYVTGGIGARHDLESFGGAYELPNLAAYCETCASIGNVFWNHRLFLLHGDARYIDVLERTLYNGLLAGVSLDGMAFFYDNPLESDGTHKRSPWFGCACCPGNIARFLPSLPGYVYAVQGDQIYVNLFVEGSVEIELGDGRTVRLSQEAAYPWEGKVMIAIAADTADQFTLNVRVPGWATNEAVPGDLYRFVDEIDEPVEIKVNGLPVEYEPDRGYAVVKRQWRMGDKVELSLPMPVRRLVADARVEDDRGKVALQRGPLIYCTEAVDNQGANVRAMSLADEALLSVEFVPDLLGGAAVVKGRATYAMQSEQSTPAEIDFTAIPYYAWANRGPNEMAVWLSRRES